MTPMNRLFQEDPRTLRLLAKLRHKQLLTARARDIERSAHYAAMACRVRRQMSGPCISAYSHVA
jgi:hypothetical protein